MNVRFFNSPLSDLIPRMNLVPYLGRVGDEEDNLEIKKLVDANEFKKKENDLLKAQLELPEEKRNKTLVRKYASVFKKKDIVEEQKEIENKLDLIVSANTEKITPEEFHDFVESSKDEIERQLKEIVSKNSGLDMDTDEFHDLVEEPEIVEYLDDAKKAVEQDLITYAKDKYDLVVYKEQKQDNTVTENNTDSMVTEYEIPEEIINSIGKFRTSDISFAFKKIKKDLFFYMKGVTENNLRNKLIIFLKETLKNLNEKFKDNISERSGLKQDQIEFKEILENPVIVEYVKDAQEEVINFVSNEAKKLYPNVVKESFEEIKREMLEENRRFEIEQKEKNDNIPQIDVSPEIDLTPEIPQIDFVPESSEPEIPSEFVAKIKNAFPGYTIEPKTIARINGKLPDKSYKELTKPYYQIYDQNKSKKIITILVVNKAHTAQLDKLNTTSVTDKLEKSVVKFNNKILELGSYSKARQYYLKGTKNEKIVYDDIKNRENKYTFADY